MNPIIQKCLDELSKDSPKIDYVRGMLETVLAMTPTNTIMFPAPKAARPAAPAEVIDEAAALDAQVRAAIEAVKKLNNEPPL